MTKTHRRRLVTTLFVLLFVLAGYVSQQDMSLFVPAAEPVSQQGKSTKALLETLEVKGRAPKTGYERTQFGDGWMRVGNCDMRNIILARDLTSEIVDSNCKVISGTLNDPYTGKTIQFLRGAETSDDIQIDHVVALSNAWQTGAQQLSNIKRESLANDPLNLLAVDGLANQQKSDGDAATWLPANKPFRCQYVTRQVNVKKKYHLWVTVAEKQTIERILSSC